MRPAARAALAVARVDFRLPGARSLKDKRQVLRSFLERARRRWNLAASESDWQDVHDRASVTLAALAESGETAGAMLRAAVAHLEDSYAVEVFAVEEERI